MIRIKELKENGYKEEDMYIISGEENNISMLRGSTDVMIKEEEGSLLDRFKSFLKGQDSITEAFSRMRLSDQDKEFYHNEVKNGKIILYIDKDYGSYYELYEDGIFKPVASSDEMDDNIKNVVVRNDELLGKDVDTVEDMPGSIKKDIGIETTPEIEEFQEETMTDLLIEEDRNRIR
jgi:hypothetical protein